MLQRATEKPTEQSVLSLLSQRLADAEWANVIGPKTQARSRIRPLAVAALAIAVAGLLYRIQPDAGFALLALIAGAAGWLLAPRVAGLIGLAEVGAVAGCLLWGIVPWPAAVVEVGLLAALMALSHLAAEREPVVHRSASLERRLEGLTLLLETVEFLAVAPGRDEILNIAVHASARGISRAGDGRQPHAAFHSVVGEQLNIAVVADEPDAREMAVGFEYPIARNQAARGAIRIGRPAFVRPDHMSGELRGLADQLGWQVLIMAPVYGGGSLQGLLAATARDGPAVDPLQQYLLGTLARLTSLSLEAASKMDEYRVAAESAKSDAVMPVMLPDVVDQLRNAVTPIKHQVLDLRASRNRENNGEDDVANTFGRLDELISSLASRTAIDSATGVLSREIGLAALERDVMRARRTQATSHSVAVLRVATESAPNGPELVRLVADRLRSRLRREDLIFRNSEDEFVCSFADMDSAAAWPILSRIQAELAREIGYTPFAIGVTPVSLAQTAG